MTAPDIVYPVRSGDLNEELRFSLRTLRNVPHGTVHLAGFIPSWINGNVNRIPVAQDANRFRSAEKNLLAAIESPDVSDPFLLFNDDFFVMRPMKQIPRLHRGPLQDVIDVYTAKHSGDYLGAMIHARDLLQSLDLGRELLSYEMHTPLIVDKQLMADVLEMRGKQNRYHLRTVYGNLKGLGGKKSEDVKVYRGSSSTLDPKKYRLLSTSDLTFRYTAAGRYIRDLFPEASSYER